MVEINPEFIRKLHDYVFVTDKVLTYKLAAAILEVSINEAKLVLKDFVDSMKSRSKSHQVTYLVGGSKTPFIHKVFLVPSDKYESFKSTFDKVNVDQIYSVQKPSFTLAVISSVDDMLHEEKDETPSSSTTKKPSQCTFKKCSMALFLNHGSLKTADQNNSTSKGERHLQIIPFITSETGNKFKTVRRSSIIDQNYENSSTKCPKTEFLDDVNNDRDILGRLGKEQNQQENTKEDKKIKTYVNTKKKRTNQKTILNFFSKK